MKSVLTTTARLLGGMTLVAACGSNPAGPAPTAVLVVTPDRTTVNSAVCPPSHCGPLTGQREVEASLTVRETGGVAGTIQKVTLTLRRRSDNTSIAGGEEGQGLRFSARGSVVVPIAVHYDETLGEANMKVVAVVDAVDENGHVVSATVEIQVIT